MRTISQQTQIKKLKKFARQKGMTLIELAVVLLVLVGLAGLTLPYVSGFVGKTHNSTSAATGADLYNALALYQTQYNGYPNGLNTLTTSASSTPALVHYLDNTFSSGGTDFGPTNFSLLTATSSSMALASLKAAGITSFTSLAQGGVTVNGDGTFTADSGIATSGATFTPEVSTTTTGTPAQFVTDSQGGVNYTAYAGTKNGISSALNYNVPTGHALIVLGVGPSNSAVGKSLASVPVHFGDSPSLQPTLTYSRFLAAFDVDTTLGTAPAKLVGIVHAPDIGDQWESVYSTIAGYYSN